MAALQFWIRGDLGSEQRKKLEAIGAVVTPMAAGGRGREDTRLASAWTMIETGPGEAETERAKIATAIGVETNEFTGPYALH